MPSNAVRSFRPLAVAATAAALVVASGCGRGVGDVSGTVTYKGKALDGGQVQFQAGGKITVADVGADGKYSAAGIPSGPAGVSVAYVDSKATDYYRALSAQGRGTGEGGKGGKAALPPPDPNGFNKIPQSYADFSNSGLTFEVKKGPNTYNIELK